jgi:hypothetical protein
MSVYLYVCIYVCLYLYVCMSVYLYVCISVFLFICLFVRFMSASTSTRSILLKLQRPEQEVCLSVFIVACLFYVFLSVCLYICLPMWLFLCLFVRSTSALTLTHSIRPRLRRPEQEVCMFVHVTVCLRSRCYVRVCLFICSTVCLSTKKQRNVNSSS